MIELLYGLYLLQWYVGVIYLWTSVVHAGEDIVSPSGSTADNFASGGEWHVCILLMQVVRVRVCL